MQWVTRVAEYMKNFGVYGTTIDIGDVLEIIIIAVLMYYILTWIKTTRAWSLLKGIIVILAFVLVAYLLHMTTILWIVKNIFAFAVTALIIVLQPELRKALEELGRKNIFRSMLPFEMTARPHEGLDEKAINEIVRACVEMGKVRTGALIVIGKRVSLSEYEQTGIAVDGLVTSQLLINIFEHNTPLHDGAVIIGGNRVTYATCYLPLSSNLGLSKELGTRHRAAVGISEVTDSLTIVVSEETGKISVAYEGKLIRNLNSDSLKTCIKQNLNIESEEEAVKSKHKIIEIKKSSQNGKEKAKKVKAKKEKASKPLKPVKAAKAGVKKSSEKKENKAKEKSKDERKTS